MTTLMNAQMRVAADLARTIFEHNFLYLGCDAATMLSDHPEETKFWVVGDFGPHTCDLSAHLPIDQLITYLYTEHAAFLAGEDEEL